MTCSAEGNPLPKYLWLQKLPSNQVLKRGYNNTLSIEDTTYDHQGEYVCEAVNVIGDQRKVVQSEPLRIEVRGKKSNWKKNYTCINMTHRLRALELYIYSGMHY